MKVRSSKSLPGCAKTITADYQQVSFFGFELIVVAGRADEAICDCQTCRSQAGGCYLSAQLTLGKPQHWLPQHKQFVESNRKLHEVVTLSVHFPGISLYICENEKRNGRCADAEVFAAGLRAA